MVPLQIFLFLAVIGVGVLAGSKCPPRVDIYPCICLDTKLNGRRHPYTTIICQGLTKTDDLNRMLPILKDLEIDKFLIYDSFWETQQLGDAGESQNVLPNDWLTLTTIKNFEVVDSTLSPNFACRMTLICRNLVTTSFIVMNSTASDKIYTLCNAGSSTGRSTSRIPWMGCMSKLETFQLSNGGLKSLPADFFPLAMGELKSLDLSNNQISKIDPNVFRNVPNIKSLDLSHNAIQDLTNIFGVRTKLEYLDVSYNALKTIGPDLISLMPKIKSFNFAYNQITDLKESEWRRAPNSLFNIDLRGNPINCTCSIRWVNSTFSVGLNILGNCATPDEYKESRIRPASRNLIDRCDDNGVIGLRKSKKNKKKN